MARKHSRMILFFLSWSLLAVPFALADMVTFDDLVPFLHNQPIYSGYAGLNWEGFYAMDVLAQYGRSYPTGYVAGMVTEGAIAYNCFGESAEISSKTPFNLVSVCLTAAWLNDLQINVEGYRGSALAYTQQVTVSPTAWTLFKLDFVGVNRVRFTSFGGRSVVGYDGTSTQFVMDNLTISNGAPATTTVKIDVKPGSDLNPINMRSMGVIPVAILSSAEFNAPEKVDPASLTFGRTGDEKSLASVKPEDVNMDGYVDLICHFVTQDTGFQCRDTEGLLKGKTKDGGEITGTDTVRIGPCK